MLARRASNCAGPSRWELASSMATRANMRMRVRAANRKGLQTPAASCSGGMGAVRFALLSGGGWRLHRRWTLVPQPPYGSACIQKTCPSRAGGSDSRDVQPGGRL